MSIYISGIEMPKSHPICIVVDAAGQARQYDLKNDRYTNDELYEAIPVPDHGKLIEAEPIMKFITDGLNNGEFGYDQIKVLAEIQYAPTIIPADKEGN